jgi:signal transduction protein with GAF and PtsI domain
MNERDKIDKQSGEHRELTDPSREEQLNLLQTITMEVAAAGDLSSALEVVLRRVCEKTGWVLGQAWVPNKDGSALDCDSVWFGGEGDLRDFRRASEAIHFKRGVGLPGRVWGSNQSAWVEDVTSDPNFPRFDAARTAGLKTGVAIPIVSRGEVIAILEFFMRESRDAEINRVRARLVEEREHHFFSIESSSTSNTSVEPGLILAPTARSP